MLTCGAAVQRWLRSSGCQSVPCGLPIPGQQLIKSVDRRASGDHPLEHIRQIGLRVEVVQLRRVDQAGQDRPGPGPILTAGEECILPAKCNRFKIGVSLPYDLWIYGGTLTIYEGGARTPYRGRGAPVQSISSIGDSMTTKLVYKIYEDNEQWVITLTMGQFGGWAIQPRGVGWRSGGEGRCECAAGPA